MNIPPFISQMIGMAVRAVVIWAAGYLASEYGVTLSDAQIGSIVAAVVPVLAVLAWSAYGKFRGRQKFLTAAASSKVMTEQEVEARVADRSVPTPSVLTPKTQLPA